jgi:hypothetical protein
VKRLVRLVAVLAVAAWPLVQIAHAGPAAVGVPPKLEVPDGNKVFLVGHAVGVQIYACNATASGYRWDFVAPQAILYGDNGKLVATHFAGPTWRATDGSAVVGHVLERVTVDSTAIPWLKLAADPIAGLDGDRLAETTYIQRIATTGGLPPAAAACDADTAGTTADVPYTADYYFWKGAGSDES